MPRFTVKDLLIATTLVAIGLAMIGHALAYPSLLRVEVDPRMIIGLGLIGAGLSTPFHRPWICLAILLFSVFLVAVIVVIVVNW